MASEQMPRKENKTMEREVHVEEQRVPKMTAQIDVTSGNNKDTPKEELKGGEEQRKQHAEKARDSQELGTEGVAAVITCRLEGNEEKEKEEREEYEGPSLEEISKYRAEAQQKSMDAISAAQERYDRAKQAASEKLNDTTQTAQEKSVNAKDIAMEKAAQTKDVTIEKGQQGYAAAKDMASKAKDVTAEKGQKGYVAAEDTISSAAKGAVDYTAPAAEKAKDYTVQAAEKAKDPTVESGKSAANVASDLKDKATDKGWGAAQFSADKTVEGTKAAANAVQGAAGYAGQKASELAAKSVGTVKGLAAAAGETAKEYTARKKEEAERELEAKKATQPQETKERTSEKTKTESLQRGEGQRQEQEGGAAWRPGGAGHTMDHVPQKDSKPHESSTVGSFQGVQDTGRERNQGEVGKTISPNAKKMKPTGESLRQSGQDVKGGNVSTTIGQNVDSAAQKEQNPNENIGGRNFEGEQGGPGKTGEQVQSQHGRKGTEAKTLTAIGGTEGNAAQREQKPFQAGETAKEYTARKKDESERELEAKKAGQPQETKQRTSEKTTSERFQRGEGQRQEQEGGATWRPSAVGHTVDKPTGENINQSGQDVKGENVSTTIGHNVDSAAQREQNPEENIAGRNFQGEQVQGEQGRKGGEAMATIDKNVDNAAQREHYSSENIAGHQGGQEQVHGRKREEEDGVGEFSGQGQGQQGRKGTEAMTSTAVGGKEVVQGKGTEAVTRIGETLGDVAHKVKKPLDNVTEGGSEVLGAVGETVAEIGETMIKPAQKVQQQGQEEKGGGGGVLNAIGETITEIAETTKVLVLGDGEAESRESVGSDSSTRRA